MQTVAAAEALIQQAIAPAAHVCVVQGDYSAASLHAPLCADRPLPPYDRVAMDGIALNLERWQAGQRRFAVAGLQRAGEPPLTLPGPEVCLEVMTGAVLPTGCDCVVPVEALSREGDSALLPEALAPGQNIHACGSDFLAGAELVPVGTPLHAAVRAVAAAVGQPHPPVSRTPRIALISTGDELVSPEATPLPHQIRSSNQSFLVAALSQAGFTRLSRHHLPDQPEALQAGLAALLADHDWLVATGGVSMGRFDLLPETFAALGVRQILHRVRQQPGKPLWFGCSASGQPVFGLPGNPVSVAVCTARYLLPALRAHLGQPERPLYACLQADYHQPKALTRFLPVRVECTPAGQLVAELLPLNGSGDLAGLAAADGLLELPPGPRLCPAGSAWRYWRWFHG